MLPGPVLVILRVLALLLAPHLALATVGIFLFSNRGVYLCCTLAVISAVCALSLHAHDRVDERIRKGFAAHERSQDALVHAMDVVAGDVPPPRRATRPLRAVPDDA